MYVGADARTRTDRQGWSEALPEQPLQARTLIETGSEEGAEVMFGEAGWLRLGPATLLKLVRLPHQGGVGRIHLLRGTLQVEGSDAMLLAVRTPILRLRLRGAAWMETTAQETALAVHRGTAELRARRQKLTLQAPAGVRLARHQRPRPLRLPEPVRWDDTAPRLLVATAPLGQGPVSVEVTLAFAPVPHAGRYLIETARDSSFRQVLRRADIPSPPVHARLEPGLHHLRVIALGAAGLPSAPSTPLALRVVSVRSNATVDRSASSDLVALRLARPLGATLEISGAGLPLRARIDDGPELDCRDARTIHLGPGEHRVHLSVEQVPTEVRVAVAAPPPPPSPPPPPVGEGTMPLGVPVPLLVPGFPARALEPRTRAWALLGVGAATSAHSLDVYRLDLGGEIALLRQNLSLDANLPVLYQRLDETGRPTLGDAQIGFRAVALRLFANRLALGPLLRLQLPTGTFVRPDELGPHPVLLDPAVALAGVLGPVALLATHGPTAVLAVPSPMLRWSTSHVVELRLGWLGIVAELDAALGMGGASSGAALSGGLRARLPGERTGRWHLLTLARGGLGASGEALFGRYYAGIGLAWQLR